MSKYGEYLAGLKDREMTRFFGEYKNRSNKYFNFTHFVNDDEVILVVPVVKTIRDSLVVVVGPNHAVYVKDWQVRKVSNFREDMRGYAVKFNRKYYKVYTFRNAFTEWPLCNEEPYTFDDIVRLAKEQDEVDSTVRLGWYGEA